MKLCKGDRAYILRDETNIAKNQIGLKETRLCFLLTWKKNISSSVRGKKYDYKWGNSVDTGEGKDD